MSDIIEYVVRVSPDGTKEWYLNGQYHREDGPAVEWPDGEKQWYLHGNLHREDGPAIELPSGTKYWCLNGKEYSESEWKKEVNKKQTCDGKLIEIDGKRYKLVEI